MPSLSQLPNNSISNVQEKLKKGACYSALLTFFALPLSTAATDFLFTLTVVLSLCSGHLVQKVRGIFQSKLAWVFLIFSLSALVGAFYSTGSYAEIIKMLNKYSRAVLVLFFVPLFFEKHWRQGMVEAFWWAMILTLLLSYGKWFGWFHYKMALGIASIFKNHIETSFLMVVAVYITALKCVEKTSYRWIYGILFLLMTYDIWFLNAGRTGYVLFMSLGLLFGYQQLRWRGLLIGVLVNCVILVALWSLPSIARDRLTQAIHNTTLYAKQSVSHTSMGERLSFWEQSVDLLAKHPVIGTGTGSVKNEMNQLHQIDSAYLKTTNPDNEYFNVGIQLGGIGILMLLLMFFFAWRESDSLSGNLRHLSQAVVLAMALGSLANSWLMDTTEGHFFYLLMALTIAARCGLKKSQQLTHHPKGDSNLK